MPSKRDSSFSVSYVVNRTSTTLRLLHHKIFCCCHFAVHSMNIFILLQSLYPPLPSCSQYYYVVLTAPPIFAVNMQSKNTTITSCLRCTDLCLQCNMWMVPHADCCLHAINAMPRRHRFLYLPPIHLP